MNYALYIFFATVVLLANVVDGIAQDAETGVASSPHENVNTVANTRFIQITDRELGEDSTSLAVTGVGLPIPNPSILGKFYNSISLNYDWLNQGHVKIVRYIWGIFTLALTLNLAVWGMSRLLPNFGGGRWKKSLKNQQFSGQ